MKKKEDDAKKLVEEAKAIEMARQKRKQLNDDRRQKAKEDELAL
jgi:hypothetical protein